MNLDEILTLIKINDSMLVATTLPESLKALGKMFAKTLGYSSAKMLKIYKEMFENLYSGETPEKVKTQVKRLTNLESKVEIKLPFLEPKTARVCGLVALNYTDYFETEVELYSTLMQDLKSVSSDSILKDITSIVKNDPEIYIQILEKKQQAIYDFGVLMGIQEDELRFNELNKNMHTEIAKYFKLVVKAHKGGFLRPSWPLPFKKYSDSILNGLYFDSISYTIQEATGLDFQFINPEQKKTRLSLIFDQMKILGEELRLNQADSNYFSNLKTGWQTLSVIPVAGLYLTELTEQIMELSDKDPGFVEQYPAYAATVIAASYVFSCENNPDSGDFTEAWTTTYLTSLPMTTAPTLV